MESESFDLIESNSFDMINERQPLLLGNDTEQTVPPRPDVRNSPENVIVDGSDDFKSPDDDYEPYKNRNLEHPTSNLETMILLIKGNIGTGILAMPDAFRNSGLYIGLVSTLFLGFVCTHCMHILVKCSHELCRRLQVPSLNFSGVCFASFETGPESLRKYSGHARNLINIFLIITQIGFCCVYFVFVAVNLQEILTHYWMKLDTHVFLILLLIPLILVNLIKTLKYLTPLSFIASILTIAGLVICFYYMLQDIPKLASVRPYATWAQLPLYFGTAIYAFEGIGVVLPLENNLKSPEDFASCGGVLNSGMIIVAILYTSVGFFGYLKYGDSVKGSITLNLGNNLLAQLVRLAMAVAIFLSYTIQFYVPVNIIGPWLRSQLHGDHVRRFADYGLRIALVLLTFILAAMIPNLGAVISLVGAVSSSALALIFPPIIEIITFWPNKLGKYNWILWKDIVIIIFGIMGFIFGTFTSVLQILHPNQDHE
ncbi:proton-coupled amino acid transporter 1 isoform X1 [Chironomus tepperi]|uniref:proton-coupled amino acid transporter 1 isoform X1 n=2 Tax=Chironomus tepperi TaxID=113505 RepID=UPI00391F7BF4